MSWCSPRLLAVGIALLAGGCGFHPLYGDRGTATAVSSQLASVAVQSIRERIGQQLTNSLRDALNPQAASVPAAYQLVVALIEEKSALVIRQDSTASRNDTSVTANWTLTRLSDHTVVLAGSSRAVTGHDVLANEYANVVADSSNQERGVAEVSNEIVTRLAYYFDKPT